MRIDCPYCGAEMTVDVPEKVHLHTRGTCGRCGGRADLTFKVLCAGRGDSRHLRTLKGRKVELVEGVKYAGDVFPAGTVFLCMSYHSGKVHLQELDRPNPTRVDVVVQGRKVRVLEEGGAS